MDVQEKLDEIVSAVDSARSMPMSASCVINRAELLAMLDEVRQALPGSLAQAQEVLGGREQVVAEAQREAERIIESARAQGGSLISESEVARRSQEEADRILSAARREAEEIRAQADDYVDSKLANFEVVLSKTIGSVDRGREKLLGRDPYGGHPDGEQARYDDAPERSGDPQELRERADAYVETQFRAFEAVLSKTLEAVGRGRQKLLGHRPTDELGAHFQDQEAAEATAGGHAVTGQGSDADYLAGLADPSAADPERPSTPPAAVPAMPPPPGADPFVPAAAGYQQDGYAPADPYAYQQQPYPGSPEQADGGTPYPTGSDGYPAPAYGLSEGYPQQGHPQGDYPQEGYDQGGYPAQPGYDAAEAGYGWQQQGGYDQGGYPQQGYDPDYGAGYAPDATGALPGTHSGVDPGQHPGYPAQPGQPGALDETSFFDTSLIDMDQLRQYEQGR